MQLTRVRYLGLAIRWKRFYQKATKDRLIRDLEYGSNGNCLDVYFPTEASEQRAAITVQSPFVNELKSIVIFVYGGTWSSGDKNMYGLLCAQLADRLNAVVLCPNYSVYPKGFVDDMVQDISDAIAYAHKFAADFGADKDGIVLIGHSAGAHLAVMTVLELSMKMLSENPKLLAEDASDFVERSDSLEVSVIDPSSIPFELHERHFNGDSNGQAESYPGTSTVPGMTNSAFCVIENIDEVDRATPELLKPETLVPPNAVNESFIVVDDNTASLTAAGSSGDSGNNVPTKPADVEVNLTGTIGTVAETGAGDVDTVLQRTGDTNMESSGVDIVEPFALPNLVKEEVTEDLVKEEATEDLLSSVRLVVGLAGVYDITAQYIHEMSRGIEDISMMARAMYGLKHFDRFSPTVIVQSLHKSAKLPPIHLIHGGADCTVPVSSSTALGDTIWKRGSSPVTATIVNGCSHVDVCLDLMEPNRYWHDIIFREIISAFNRHVLGSTSLHYSKS
jgi:acetyl esterase/lipase